MHELNTAQSIATVEEDGCDTLTLVDMGEIIALSQVADDETLHNVMIGLKQAATLRDYLNRVLG